MLLINPSKYKFGGSFSHYVPLPLPMTIGTLSAYMDANGYPSKVYDEELELIDAQNIERIIEGLPKPYIFGISILTSQAARAYNLAKFLKTTYPDCIVIVGGFHATALPEESLNTGAIDFVVRGEGERVLLELYEAIRGDRKDFSEIKGICFKDGDQVISTPDAALIADLNTLPLFPYYKYVELLKNCPSDVKYDWGFTITSRGCPYECNFCAQRMMTGITYRYQSVENVLKNLNVLVNELGATNIYLMDDNFLTQKTRVKELCDGIYESGLWEKCEFSLQTRADDFNEKLMPYLQKARFTTVGFGLEVGTDRLMETLKKDIKVETYFKSAELANRYGLGVALYLMFGVPGETSEDREQAYQIVKKIKPVMAKVANLIPFPGTPLYDDSLKNSPRLNIVGTWESFDHPLRTLGFPLKKPAPLPYVPEDASEWEITRDIIKYNFLNILQLNKIVGVVSSKSKHWWARMKPRWYLYPMEYYHLIKIGLILVSNLSFALLPLWLTEPIMEFLYPELQKRVPEKKRSVYIAPEWSKESQRKVRA
ncbi:MAG: B12-binding domain-containing radical SAM protein [Nitrospina sp.]|nr:B12-binding domain-containing radical SAM protein [Nitrospina sp.]MBT3874441.1 B12-binding domain-containing radical SAM protein [Nitrospina sp.]MBT4049073.1 B12-binding domain-containing radical SAM protein [Nitrospina sp.]MBT4559111.1 B12-binding domain-containing radical SAM protein [Nitrospina sp.]MBT5347777.1 B12-binding domain-containing radical SAM protein [Nitrospina sp.]